MGKKQYYSRAYHQYFEDFAEKEVELKNGKRHIERVYVGNYYRIPYSDRKWVCQKAIFVILYAMSVFFLIHAGLQNLSMNYVSTGKYSIIPQVVSFVSLFLFLIPLFYRVTAPRAMMIRIFRDSSERLKRNAVVTACILSVTVTFSIVYLALNGQLLLKQGLICVAENAVSAGAMWAIYVLERNTKYEVLPSTARRSANSSIIRY